MDIRAAAGLLGLDPTQLTVDDIDKAFRRAALLNHPDKGGSSAAFMQVTEAAELLRDSLKGPEDSGLEILLDSLGRALHHVKVSAQEVHEVMTVRVFCTGLWTLQNQGRDVRVVVRDAVVVALCAVTGVVVAEGHGFTKSAVNFFRGVTEAAPDVEISFSEYGVDVSSTSLFRFRSVSAKEIATIF